MQLSCIKHLHRGGRPPYNTGVGRQLRQLLMLLLMMFGAQSFALGFDPTCGHEESPICAHCAFLAHSGREQDVPLSTIASNESANSGREFPHHFEAFEIADAADGVPSPDQDALLVVPCGCPKRALLLPMPIECPPAVRLVRRVLAEDTAPRGPPSLLTQDVAA